MALVYPLFPVVWKFEREQLRDTFFAGVPLIGSALIILSNSEEQS